MEHTKNIIMEDTYIPTEQEEREAYDQYQALTSLQTVADKAEIFKRSMRDQILSGHTNPLEFYRQAKIVAEAIEELKKDPDILDCAVTERQKWGKEKATVNGSVMDVQQRTTYDYDSCGDPVYDKLKKEVKEREAFLKAIKEPTTLVMDGGEAVTIMPPTQKISQFITVKI